jgi:hypothetical protein
MWRLTVRMSFKSRDNRFLIEEASSGRARCRRCRKPIAKGALRLRIVAFVCPGRTHAFFRCCVDAKLAAAVLAVHGSAERVPCASTMDAGRAAQMRLLLERAGRRASSTPAGEEAQTG